jgi:hypothetical protein
VPTKGSSLCSMNQKAKTANVKFERLCPSRRASGVVQAKAWAAREVSAVRGAPAWEVQWTKVNGSTKRFGVCVCVNGAALRAVYCCKGIASAPGPVASGRSRRCHSESWLISYPLPFHPNKQTQARTNAGTQCHARTHARKSPWLRLRLCLCLCRSL